MGGRRGSDGRRRGRARTPRAGPEVEATVDGLAHGGEGVAHVEGKAVFVAGTLPGERVRIRIHDPRPRWARARLVRVLEASPDRVEPVCPFVPHCGGCSLQHATPDAQRRLKTRVVRDLLERIGGLRAPPVRDCKRVGPELGYRTHARLHARADGRLGFRRAGSRRVVPVDRCAVLAPAAQTLRDAVGDGTGAVSLEVWGHARTDTAAVVLTPGQEPLRLPKGRFGIALLQPDGSLSTARPDVELTERIAGIELGFDPSCFFQVSPEGAEGLVAEVLRASEPRPGLRSVDLFAGVGLLSLPLARAGAQVIAVEAQANAASWLAANARRNGLEVAVAAEAVDRFLAREDLAIDLAVLDPPRAGAGLEVIRRLCRSSPRRIVYVACEPAALARDARELASHGYRMREAVPLDLFPMTHQVEVVARFEPESGGSGALA